MLSDSSRNMQKQFGVKNVCFDSIDIDTARVGTSDNFGLKHSASLENPVNGINPEVYGPRLYAKFRPSKPPRDPTSIIKILKRSSNTASHMILKGPTVSKIAEERNDQPGHKKVESSTDMRITRNI